MPVKGCVVNPGEKLFGHMGSALQQILSEDCFGSLKNCVSFLMALLDTCRITIENRIQTMVSIKWLFIHGSNRRYVAF
jgi:hypothetical protein